jgi:hypothetical protein
VVLKDHSEKISAETAELVGRHRRKVVTSDYDLAVIGAVKSRANVQERRFSRSRRSYNGNEFSVENTECGAIHRRNDGIVLLVLLDNAFG